VEGGSLMVEGDREAFIVLKDGLELRLQLGKGTVSALERKKKGGRKTTREWPSNPEVFLQTLEVPGTDDHYKRL